MEDVFITGIDIGVGKTYVACALLGDLRAKGHNALGMKPICCGNRSDVRLLREAMGAPTLSLELLNPCYLRAHAEPLIAARLERRVLEPAALAAAYRELKAQGYGPILVEGSGAWESPMAPDLTMADFAAELALPVIIVAANRQGAASHVILAARSIRERGLRCKGVILNKMDEEWDTAAVTNRQLIEESTGLPVLAELIHGDELTASCLE